MLPQELWEEILLPLEFPEICAAMQTCSDLWLKFRFNGSFWNRYYVQRYGSLDQSPLQKLGDPFKSVKARFYSRWILAERIIDVFYESMPEKIGGGVYGGYLRDRMAKRRDFCDINVFLPAKSAPSFLRTFRDELSRRDLAWQDHERADGAYRLWVENERDVVLLRVVLASEQELAADFDVNGLCLRDRRTYGLIYSRSRKELDQVMDRCRKRTFLFCPLRIPNMAALQARYEYMLKLGFCPVAPEYVAPQI